MQDPLTDCTPLIDAACSGKLRLVRLLVEGGAQVNGSNPRGETALLAACKALRGEPAGPETVKLLKYLLQNQADPNAQDHTGRTALMYACKERAGVQVAQTLLAGGADPCMEDRSGASALVYAINAQHQPTVQLGNEWMNMEQKGPSKNQILMDACRARGRDIIIIAMETGANGNPVTRRYLNVPPSLESSPVSCMSPSEIVLKTSSPNSPEGENIFNFRGTNKHGSGSSSRRSSCELSSLSPCSSPASRPRVLSEPWLAIQNLASLNRAYEEGMRERTLKEDGGVQGLRRGRDKKDEDELCFHPAVEPSDGSEVQRKDQSVLSLTEKLRCSTPGGSASDKKLPSNASQLRRNTLPFITLVPPPLYLPALTNQSDAHLKVPSNASPSTRRTIVFQPHPPRSSLRPASLPPLASSATSLVAPPACFHSHRSRGSLRRHSVQLEQIR